MIPKGLEFWLLSGLNICSSSLNQYGNIYSFNKCLLNFHGAPGVVLGALRRPSRHNCLRGGRQYTGKQQGCGSRLCVELWRKLRKDTRECQRQMCLKDLEASLRTWLLSWKPKGEVEASRWGVGEEHWGQCGQRCKEPGGSRNPDGMWREPEEWELVLMDEVPGWGGSPTTSPGRRIEGKSGEVNGSNLPF